MTSGLKKIYIFGASGFGKEVLDVLVDINTAKETYEILGFIDDNKESHGKTLNGVKICGGADFLKNEAKSCEIYAVVAVGDSIIRERIVKNIEEYVNFENIIHPEAKVSKFAKMGKGNILTRGVNVMPNVTIGDFCVFNMNTNIGHDAVVSDFVSAMSHCDITGNVKIGKSVYLGSSVCIHPSVTIGESAQLGIGAVVISNIKENSVAMGNPARVIK